MFLLTIVYVHVTKIDLPLSEVKKISLEKEKHKRRR